MSNAHTKQEKKEREREREREKSDKITWTLFPPRPGRTFPLIKPLNWRLGGRIETVQVRKEHEGFEKISKRSKRGLKLILASKCYHIVALLSG